MNRRTMLAALGTTMAAFPGCVADGPGTSDDRTTGGNRTGRTTGGNETDRTTDADADSVVAQFDGEPVRPECERESETVEVEYGDETREHETAETVPYPDAPAEFGRDDVIEYVEAFEHAYVTHDVLCDGYGSGHILRVGYNVRQSETFEWYDDVTVVFLLRAGAATWGTDGRGNVWQADVAHDGIVYAVDETGAARVEFEEAPGSEDEFESQAPDPLDDGELVATFE